jgi:hypothetical protein
VAIPVQDLRSFVPSEAPQNMGSSSLLRLAELFASIRARQEQAAIAREQMAAQQSMAWDADKARNERNNALNASHEKVAQGRVDQAQRGQRIAFAGELGKAVAGGQEADVMALKPLATANQMQLAPEMQSQTTQSQDPRLANMAQLWGLAPPPPPNPQVTTQVPTGRYQLTGPDPQEQYDPVDIGQANDARAQAVQPALQRFVGGAQGVERQPAMGAASVAAAMPGLTPTAALEQAGKIANPRAQRLQSGINASSMREANAQKAGVSQDLGAKKFLSDRQKYWLGQAQERGGYRAVQKELSDARLGLEQLASGDTLGDRSAISSLIKAYNGARATDKDAARLMDTTAANKLETTFNYWADRGQLPEDFRMQLASAFQIVRKRALNRIHDIRNVAKAGIMSDGLIDKEWRQTLADGVDAYFDGAPIAPDEAPVSGGGSAEESSNSSSAVTGALAVPGALPGGFGDEPTGDDLGDWGLVE